MRRLRHNSDSARFSSGAHTVAADISGALRGRPFVIRKEPNTVNALVRLSAPLSAPPSLARRFPMKNQTILITGGTTGIGPATA